MSKASASNTLLLRRQLAELTKHPVEGFSAGGPLILLLISRSWYHLHWNQALSTTTISLNGKSSLLGTTHIHRTHAFTHRVSQSQASWYPVVCFQNIILLIQQLIFDLDLLSEGGFFKARLSFPPEFPLLPPKMRFITPMWHPNSQCLWLAASASLTFFSVYSDGTVCVSILVSQCQYRLKSEPTFLMLQSTHLGTINTGTKMLANGGCRYTRSNLSYGRFMSDLHFLLLPDLKFSLSV